MMVKKGSILFLIYQCYIHLQQSQLRENLPENDMKLQGKLTKQVKRVTDEIINNDSCGTELIMVDIRSVEEHLKEMKQKLTEPKEKNESLKFTLDNIACTDKKVSLYTRFLSHEALMACFLFLGPVVNKLIICLNSKLDDDAAACDVSEKNGLPRNLYLIY